MFHKIIPLLILVLILTNSVLAAGTVPRITHLKNLHLDTEIVSENRAGAIIISPTKKIYVDQAKLIQTEVKKLTGVTLPIYTDNLPKDVLRRSNVIALGNMSNNPFIERLYRQWYCLLDLKYPGEGGYVVRSLHDPYGTGRNVILLGGSDAEGAREAVQKFVKILQKAQKDNSGLKVGWLMHIKLGNGIELPKISLASNEWNVSSWRDSWRKTPRGKKVGYKPSTYFGWNPISIAGILYYMTGEKSYLDAFKAMAMPEAGNIPVPNRKSDAFYDPLDPLVKNYHYRAHLVDCVWDLIEESPLFSNQDRLFITNKLLKHQYHYDPNSDYSKPYGNRHALWQMMCIYTGSRYFAKYYPDPIWEKRLKNIRKAFASFLTNQTWGERDTLYWVSTSIEPVFDFYMLDGFERFVSSGAARHMMKALEILMTGEEIDDYNKFLSINLLHKAGYMLQDGRYYWMAKQLFDFRKFRIGQSYWPNEDIDIAPATDWTERIMVYPLSERDRKQAGSPTPLKESFQILCYRSGLSARDDYFLLDGFTGLGRNPYQLNSIYYLRMFNGKKVLRGYENDIDIWRNGMVDLDIPRCAALKEHFAAADTCYIASEVPYMSGASWKRHLLYLAGNSFIVLDQLKILKEGDYDIVCSWNLAGTIRKPKEQGFTAATRNWIRLDSADVPLSLDGKVLQENLSRKLERDDQFVFGNVLSTVSQPKTIFKIGPDSFFLKAKDRSAIVDLDGRDGPGFSTDARFCYLSENRLILINGTYFNIGDKKIIRADAPVTLQWNWMKKVLDLSSSVALNLSIAAQGPFSQRIARGSHKFFEVELNEKMAQAVKSVIQAAETDLKPKKPVAILEKRKATNKKRPKWAKRLKGTIKFIAKPGVKKQQWIWTVTESTKGSTIYKIANDGTILLKLRRNAKVLSVWAAQDLVQAKAFALLVGYDDDALEALSEDGKTLWRIKAKIHPSFKIGDRYRAPWFTDPGPKYNRKGIYSILVADLWDTGRQEIVIGRPCTVEFRRLDGSLIKRVPTKWGNNTSLAVLKKRGAGKRPLLLVGKNYTGYPGITGINDRYEVVSNSLFAGLPKKYVSMHAWLQRGIKDLKVADIDNDGIDEVIYTLSGHWNELRVYDGATSKLQWVRYFGPGRNQFKLMTTLKVIDEESKGLKLELVTRNGRIYAFDINGKLLWSKNF